jgi:shikimate kinase
MDAEWEECLDAVEKFITDYLKKGKYADKLKKSEAVAFGFVDGDSDILYRKE